LSNNYNIIGVQAGGQCFAGKDVDYRLNGSVTTCSALGDNWINNVYTYTGYNNPTDNKWTSRGCYKDTVIRSLPTNLGTYATVEKCESLALSNNYNIVGLQAGGQCFAGKDVDYAIFGSVESCGALGDNWVNNVYTYTGYNYTKH
jgi:hypothetical protein